MLNAWLSNLCWCLAFAASVVILAIVVQRTSYGGTTLPPFMGAFSLVALVAAVTGSILWTLLRAPSMQTAAAQLDVAAGLKERISTGLYCQSSDDPFHQAVLNDARKLGARITPSQHLPIRFPHSANFAIPGVLGAVILFFLLPTINLSGKQQIVADDSPEKEALKRMENAVQVQLNQEIGKIREKNELLKDELEPLEPMQATGAETPMDVRRNALKKVEKLSQKLEEKKSSERYEEMQEMKKLLRRIAQRENAAETPVGKLASSLSQGDFKEAKRVLDELELKLKTAPKTEEEKRQAEQLRKQLEQLGKQIQNVAENDQKNKDELAKAGMNQQEIQRALDSLQKKDLESLKKQLEKKGLDKQQVQKMMKQMQQRGAACDAAKQLGQKLAQGAQKQQQQGAQGGQPGQGQQPGQQQAGGGSSGGQQGQQGMGQAGQQLSELEAMQQQLNEIESAMTQLDQMKNDLGQGCSQCQGTGMKNGQPCGGCQGSGMAQGQQGGQGNSGMGGLGRGQGGVAPEQATNFNLKKERTDVFSKAGHIIHQEFVEGEQFKGEASPELRGASLSANRYATETIESGDVPGVYQESISKYFQRNYQETTSGN